MRHRARISMFSALAAAAAAALAGGGCDRASSSTPSSPPSIVLLTVDTLRADRLGSYGHTEARTPVLDALAARGVRFAAATTPFPRTTPALASMMTGLLPWRHGSREVGQPMTATLETLPSILHARGYRTLGVCVNGAAGRTQHLDVGFERFLDYQSFTDHTAAGVTDATVGLLDEVLPAGGADAAGDSPFLLWVHYIDPHFPYQPPASWTDQPAATSCREMTARTGADMVATAHVRIDLGGEASAALADCAALYDAEIAFTDFHLGRLLHNLESRGLLSNAFVVFTADHGENLGEDGLYFEHGPSVHDASLKVPLMIAGPGLEPRVDHGIARLEDLPPTLLALAGVPASAWPPFDGADLSPRLRGKAPSAAAAAAAAPESAVAESGRALLPETFLYLDSGRPGGRQCTNGARYSLCIDPGEPPRLFDHLADPFLERDLAAEHPDVTAALLAVRKRWPPGQARERTIRTTRWKLVERPRPEGGFRAELFDLTADPGERRDLAAEQPGVTARLEAELDSAMASAAPPPAPALDRHELETLRALGYVR